MVKPDEILEAQAYLAYQVVHCRTMRQWTQIDLSKESGVALSTLRKFEQTGKISLESFLKLCFALDIAIPFLTLTTEKPNYTTLDELLTHEQRQAR